MNRWITFAPSGSQVVACGRLGATVPPVTFTWYHRGAAKPVAFARRTVCVTHNDSAPLMLLYWFCIIARIASVSRLFPPSDGTVAMFAFGQLVAASGVSGPVSVDCEMWSQSTWTLYTPTAFRNCEVDTQ